MSESHAHAIPSTHNERSLWAALALTGGFLVAEAVSDWLLNSLALLADAAHMFTDSAALAIALAAIRIGRLAADSRRTYGYHRFEILAATFNALLLFAVAIYILYEAYQRWDKPAELHSTGILIVGVLGLGINLISMRLLAVGKDSSLNVKGAYLEVWSDMLGSVGVIVAAIIIGATGWAWVDSLVAVGIGLWILPRTWILLKESLNILLEGTPAGIDVSEVSRAITELPGIKGVHDLHIWALSSGKNILTVHVVCEEQIDRPTLIKTIQATIADRFDILHSTLQLELTPCARLEDGSDLSEGARGHAGDAELA